MSTVRPPAPRRTPRAPSAAPTETPRAAGRPPGALVAVRRVFTSENGNFFLLLGVTLFLVVFGLIMVLSSSAVESRSENHDFFFTFLRQGSYAVIGVPLMLLASRLPLSFWKRWAWTAVVVAIALQCLVFVPGIGWGTGGNQNWIKIAGINAQPSELVKLALIIWISHILVTKQALLSDIRHVAIPVLPVAGLAILLVLRGNDLGTAIIMGLIVFGLLFYGGVKLRFLGLGAAIVALLGWALTISSDSRMARIEAWLSNCPNPRDFNDACWQTVHGWWALASGGVFGSGLGGSRQKWRWLPESDNDFIFAIIGDELGLIGAIVVLLLFVLLAIAFLRIARSATDPFARIATSGVMIWVLGQAFVNIGVVLGLLPVFGVPLPLISAGGSALITTLLGIGMVLSFARTGGSRPAADEPEVRMTPADRSRLAAAQRARPVR